MRRFDHDHYYMQESDEGKYVLHADHAAELAEWKQRAERAEAYVAGQDVRSDFRTAAEMRAVLDFTRKAWSEEVAANALLRAECEAWRKAVESMPKPRSAADHDHELEGKWDFTGEACDECALWIAADNARAATDAAGVLKGVE